jgi:hypothetical protein
MVKFPRFATICSAVKGRLVCLHRESVHHFFTASTSAWYWRSSASRLTDMMKAGLGKKKCVYCSKYLQQSRIPKKRSGERRVVTSVEKPTRLTQRRNARNGGAHIMYITTKKNDDAGFLPWSIRLFRPRQGESPPSSPDPVTDAAQRKRASNSHLECLEHFGARVGRILE